MGMYKSIRTTVQETSPARRRELLAEWRKTNTVTRVSRPHNLSRARSLGYRAKQGILVTRVRVLRGGRKRELIKKGRRSKTRRMLKILDMNYQTVCEQRAQKKFQNCEVLNSYYLNKDGKHIWYDVILVDRNSPTIVKDKQLAWIASGKHTHRAQRGLTSSARRTRGLHKKGKGTEKVRPSRAASLRRKNN